ncbi:hypothetical protein [Acholeplasma hippikon]|uniref:Nucleotidyl transferase AbiEii toxin, Type IV TA system n=1 Tax=Acholeplasma hippikon TaxID=264636 RepID=A0A449BIL0_9MOLU|nr:hypothetical protein [Acholeplasma hippikon]VEU82270.1 Uncharacterised protein [Acholeplasma hippikon]
MQKEKLRLADLFQAFDNEVIVEPLKLTGLSALQYLIKETEYFQNKLQFDFDTTLDVKHVSEVRKELLKQLPHILLKQSFSIDAKKSEFTSSFDNYVILDEKSKLKFDLRIDYLNRSHILKPEQFARKDETFKDIHINSLGLAENYAIYIVNYLVNDEDSSVLKTLFSENKIIIQQVPFIRKMVAFYLSLMDNQTINEKKLFNDVLKEIINFNEKELAYLTNFKNGIYQPDILFPPTLAKNILNHPKALLKIKKINQES